MDPDLPDNYNISDVVVSTAGHDRGELFYVASTDEQFLYLVNGKDRTLDKPKRKRVSTYKRSFALRPESQTASAERQSAQKRITKNPGN